MAAREGDDSGEPYAFVQHRGERVAELRDKRSEDMFWYSFKVIPLGTNNARALDGLFWSQTFQIEELSTCMVFHHVFPRRNGALDKPDRVWLRWGAGVNSPKETHQLANLAKRKRSWWRRLLFGPK